MTSAETAAAFVALFVPTAIVARWFILWRRGRLIWGHQLPLALGGLAIVTSALLITVAGQAAQQVAVPTIILLAGMLLTVPEWGIVAGVPIRWLGIVSIIGGLLLLARGIVALAVT